MSKLTVQNVVDKLNKTEYPLRIDPEFAKELKEAGLVVVYGHSDDLIEFEGAIYDELGAGDGTQFLISPDGVLCDRDQLDTDEELEKWLNNKKIAKTITSFWYKDDISWQYETDLVHQVFEVVEYDDIFCKALVFDLNQF